MTTKVDGPNIPPFQQGQGRFDTGDVPQFNTGDTVRVTFQSSSIGGESSKALQAGTTTVNINGDLSQPPTINSIPDQIGIEDVPWTLDLDHYISDPDTPKSSLNIKVNSNYITVAGQILTFQYPEGVTSEIVTVTVSDSTSLDTEVFNVAIEPVNDPPHVTEIEPISLMEGSQITIDLSPYVEDPDDNPGSMKWTIQDPGDIEASIQGSILEISVPKGSLGIITIRLRVQDPGGLTDDGSIQVEVGANITALMEFYDSQIALLNSQIMNLSASNSNLVSQLATLNSVISQLEDANSVLQSNLEKAESSLDSILGELDQLRAQKLLQGEAISALEAEKAELESVIASLEDDAGATISSYLSIISDLNETCKNYLVQIDEIEAQIAELEENITSLEAEALDNEESILTLESDKEDLQNLLSSKESELDRLVMLESELNAQVASLEAQKAQTEDALTEIEIELQQLQAENMLLQSRLEKLNNTVTEKVVPATNTTEDNRTLTGDILGGAARLAQNGVKLVMNGLDNSLLLLVVTIIAITSGVTIMARTSWLQIGSGYNQTSSVDLWNTIQNRASDDSQSSSLKLLGIENLKRIQNSTTSFSTAFNRQTQMIKRKPSTKIEKRRKVVASIKPVSINKKVPNLTGRSDELPDRSNEHPDRGSRESDSVVTPQHIDPEEIDKVLKAMNKGVRWQVEKQESVDEIKHPPQVEEKPDPVDKTPDSEGDMLSSGLSEVDREYIKTLIELGYTKEAEDELRKRSSAK